MKHLSLFLLLTACAHPLPADMVVTTTTYTDPQKLAEKCKGAEACVFTDMLTYCDMHLSLAANGEPMHREHELTHCAGRKDPPSTRG